MKTAGLSTLALTAFLAAGCAKPEPASPAGEAAVKEPKPPAAAQDVPPAMAEVIRERGKLHRRQTGALLTVAARWEKDPGLEHSVRVYWTIDYDGPRRPFTVLTPGKGLDEVTAHLWYPRPDGTVAKFTSGWGGRMPGKQPTRVRDWFSVSDGGRPVTGRLAKGASYLKGYMGWDRDPGPGDPPLWVQLEYAPADRGDGYDMAHDPATGYAKRGADWTLDAWTGRLLSPIVPVVPE